MKLNYKRYMVFSWTEYDNVVFSECIKDSFDDLKAARDYILANCEFSEDETPLFCIFDRVECKRYQ